VLLHLEAVSGFLVIVYSPHPVRDFMRFLHQQSQAVILTVLDAGAKVFSIILVVWGTWLSMAISGVMGREPGYRATVEWEVWFLYWITMAAAGILGILFLLARKEDVPEDSVSLMKPFYQIALYLLKRIWHRFPKLFTSVQVEKDLALLHPGEAREYLETAYYVKKTALFLTVVSVGTLFGAAVKLSAQSGIILGEDGAIARWGYQEGTREIIIAAEYGEKQMDFQVQVEPRLLTEGESEGLFDDFLEKLPELILGSNEDMMHITSDLVLEEEYGEFPLTVEWTSSRQSILSNTGHVYAVEKEEQVSLFLSLHYEGYCREAEVTVILTPPVLSEEEQLYRDMEEMLVKSQGDSLDQEKWQLPDQWRGVSIRWRQLVEDNSLLIWAAAVAVAVLVYVFSDRDLHEQIEKRKKNLRWEYPEIVHKLVLFVGAGMTIRGAFQKIAGDYEAKRQEGCRQQPAYEEMLYTCRELQAGVSEGASYEHFGRRTGLQEYIRLCTLLAQNLKRGNHTLLERLREEADKAAEEQLQQGRKLGEEAGTKLLIPMVMMLAMVMVMIMVPAFATM